MPSIKLAELVQDMTLYPRHCIDSVHVGNIAEARRAGEKLPAIIVDKKSRRIVDGFHRYQAERQVFGEEGSIEVEFRSYPNEREMVLDAIRLNSHHGRRLDRMDQVRAIIMAEAVGADTKIIANALAITEERVEVLRVRVAMVPPTTPNAVPRSNPPVITLKRSTAHLEGKRITKDMAAAHNAAPGTSYGLIIRQLTDALKEGLLPADDENLIGRLRVLRDAINAYVRAIAA